MVGVLLRRVAVRRCSFVRPLSSLLGHGDLSPQESFGRTSLLELTKTPLQQNFREIAERPHFSFRKLLKGGPALGPDANAAVYLPDAHVFPTPRG